MQMYHHPNSRTELSSLARWAMAVQCNDAALVGELFRGLRIDGCRTGARCKMIEGIVTSDSLYVHAKQFPFVCLVVVLDPPGLHDL
jgi:hypothetical protein